MNKLIYKRKAFESPTDFLRRMHALCDRLNDNVWPRCFSGVFSPGGWEDPYCNTYSILDYRYDAMLIKEKRMTELKPCPFCGSTNLRVAQNYLERYSILCLDCTMIVFGRDDTDRGKKDELVEAWNRRAESERT